MISIILIFVCSIFFVGIINRTKSLASGRKGPPILQSIKDIMRLSRKNSVYSSTTSFIFRITPSIYFASIILAILFIPFTSQKGILSFEADFVVFVYVLSLGKFFSVISALDTGSSFEGMGASRETLYSLLAEPAFFTIIGSYTLLTGHTSFYEIFNAIHYNAGVNLAFAILSAFVLVMITMVENSRMPFDDPNTHLELTMVHEVMILDNSGFDLALIQYGSILKFLIYGSLIANFFLTPEIPIYFSIASYILIQVVFAITIGLIESFIARFRMNHNPQYILAFLSVSLLIFFGTFLFIQNYF